MKADSHIFMIFGATGDLTRRKLIPALYHLIAKGRLADNTPIVCIGRKQLSRQEYLDILEPARFIEDVQEGHLKKMFDHIEYIAFDPKSETTEAFEKQISAIRKRYDCAANYLIYLALPTSVFQQSVELIGKLHRNGGWRRVVFEKPFGRDLESAIQLNENIQGVLQEQEIFRVDHYLGKELVQNILTLRFGNEVFSGGWGKEAIDHVQITVAEKLGVEKRAGYYDASGAVRDMLQNHLLQLFSLIAMDPPSESGSEGMRDQAVKVMKQLHRPGTEDIVLGQYTAGNEMAGYLAEDGVAADSTTETFAAVKVQVDNERWQGVPFYLRTGKRMHRRFAEIRVVFRRGPRYLIGNSGDANEIIIRIQPDEGLALAINVRKPGERSETESVLMDFCHHCHFGPNTPEAYESILYNIMRGDHTLFPRRDWIEASWAYIDSLREVAAPPATYPAGTSGPAEAEELLQRDGRKWIGDPSGNTRMTRPSQS